MIDASAIVATILTPERGVFQVRVPSGAVVAPGSRWIVSLDYGEDVCTVQTAPRTHLADGDGGHVPSFRLMRPYDPDEDGKVEAENVRLAESMRAAFQRVATSAAPDLAIDGERLSFGRTRLFLRYTTAVQHPDFGPASAELSRLFGVSVAAWRLTPRDVVASNGALAPCGRVCCCAGWLVRPPCRLSPADARAMGVNAAQMNGVCGRVKCCLAFEEREKK